MDDDKPKKWYLKGVLAAIKKEKNKTEEPLIVTSEEDDSEEKEFYRWPDEKLVQYQAEQFDSPEKEKVLKEYLKKLQEYKDEHDGQEPPMAPAGSDSGKSGHTGVSVDKFKGIPQYLAYFQHAFDLDKTNNYRRFYEGEAHVSEDLRKVAPYKRKNRELYREMFKLLKRRDDSLSSIKENAEKKNEETAEEDAAEDEKTENSEVKKEEKKGDVQS